MRNGEILTDDANVNITTNIVTDSQRNRVSTLTVSSFSMSDEGNYICNVSNTAGSVVSGGLSLGKCWVITCLMYTQPMWLSAFNVAAHIAQLRCKVMSASHIQVTSLWHSSVKLPCTWAVP